MISQISTNVSSIYKLFNFSKIELISFSKLKIEVKKAGINSQRQYRKQRKPNWPSNPNRYYKDEWISWPNLFGREKIKLISFSKLKIEVKKAGINSQRQYEEQRKPNWPSVPHKYYKDEWISWPNLFGKEELIRVKLISFSKLKIEVKKAGINSQRQYKKQRKSNWPSNPNRSYKNEWISWNDLFGKEKIKLISFSELKIEVKKAGINSQLQYHKQKKANWPSNPHKYYNEWISWNDLLGREKIKLISFSKLKIEVKKAGINSVSQYKEQRKSNWPSHPDQCYKDEWISWNDLFGREKIKLISFSELKIEVKKSGINNERQYRKQRKPNWPSAPDKYYNEWISWPNLFGREKIKLISFSKLKIEVKKAGINSNRQYLKQRKPNWPSNPDRYYKYYKDEWISWNDLYQ